MTLDLYPLDYAISEGIVPAADRSAIVDTLASVPEGRRQKTLEDIIESYHRARKYLESVRGLIEEKATKRTIEPETRRVSPDERRPKRSRSEKYAEDLLNLEKTTERKLDPGALTAVFKNSPSSVRANVRRLLDRMVKDIEMAKEALK